MEPSSCDRENLVRFSRLSERSGGTTAARTVDELPTSNVVEASTVDKSF